MIQMGIYVVIVGKGLKSTTRVIEREGREKTSVLNVAVELREKVHGVKIA